MMPKPKPIMKKVSPKSVPPEVRAWFGNQIQHIAMHHDLAGPQIGRVRRGRYFQELVKDLRARALTARETGQLAITAEELDLFCKRAARELMAIRRIRADHESGKLPTDLMRQLPAYAAFKDYLDEAPTLVLSELMTAARNLDKPKNEELDLTPLCLPDHPAHPVSSQVRSWMELHALGLALADDTGGPVFGTVSKEDYITNSALRIRAKARRAVRGGDLSVPTEDLDKICWVVAGEAYLLRSLQAQKQAGQLTKADIKRMPIYGPYKDYFEMGSDLVSMAMNIGAALGQPIPPRGARN
jgi:hypothetical protein